MKKNIIWNYCSKCKNSMVHTVNILRGDTNYPMYKTYCILTSNEVTGLQIDSCDKFNPVRKQR